MRAIETWGNPLMNSLVTVAQADCLGAHYALSNEISRQASVASERNFEHISRLAFLLGFQARTLAETLLWTMHFDVEKISLIMKSASDVLARIEEMASRYKENSLDWRDLYFDDVFSDELIDLSFGIRNDLLRENAATDGAVN